MILGGFGYGHNISEVHEFFVAEVLISSCLIMSNGQKEKVKRS